MRLFLANTIWKRQLRTVLVLAVGLAVLAFIIGVFLIVTTLAAGNTLYPREFFGGATNLIGVVLIVQLFLSGLLLGAEEEENQTESFVLRLPVSKARWVAERLLADVIALIICFLSLFLGVIILGLFYLKIPDFWSDVWNAIAAVFTFSNIAFGFSYFWICGGCAACIKKVLASAITSVGAVFLIFLGAAKLLSVTRFSYARLILHYGVEFKTVFAFIFIVLSFLFLGLFFYAISRREGT